MKRKCSIEGCNKDHLARGLCQSHYQRLRKYGDPLKIGGNRGERKNAERAFIQEAVAYKGKECLIWPFSRHLSGYALSWLLPRHFVYVSQYICSQNNGPIPTPRHEAAHSCGKGANGCVAGSHLRWATHKENMEDRNNYKRGIK